jgi:phage terminase large subunit-like protein
LFPSDDYDELLTLFWIPEENMRKRVQRDGVPYDVWTREGWINTTAGSVIDYDYIERELLELREHYQIDEIAIDPWNSTQLAVRLREYHGFNVVAHRQGYASMSAPAKELEARILSGRLRHGGNPVLRWMIGNAALDVDAAGNIKPAKNRSTEKIDGVVALVMAISGDIRTTEEKVSSYENRGITFL